MNVGGKPSFIVADDHPLVRQGVRLVLEAEFADSQVIEAANLDEVLAGIVQQPDAVLLIDLDMPGMDGIESLRALRQDFPPLVMAVLSGNSERTVIAEALNAGVNGYIVKASPPEELLYAISTIRSGRVYLASVLTRFSDKAASAAPSALPNPDPASRQEPSMLTPRQREVITWLMKGHSNKQIARDLNLGEGTVKIHLASIFRALGVQNRTEAVMKATRLGI
jgi:DNA-binding NarL/FixJ family response regulator